MSSQKGYSYVPLDRVGPSPLHSHRWRWRALPQLCPSGPRVPSARRASRFDRAVTMCPRSAEVTVAEPPQFADFAMQWETRSYTGWPPIPTSPSGPGCRPWLGRGLELACPITRHLCRQKTSLRMAKRRFRNPRSIKGRTTTGLLLADLQCHRRFEQAHMIFGCNELRKKASDVMKSGGCKHFFCARESEERELCPART